MLGKKNRNLFHVLKYIVKISSGIGLVLKSWFIKKSGFMYPILLIARMK